MLNLKITLIYVAVIQCSSSNNVSEEINPANIERLFGGQYVESIDQFPFQAAIFYYNKFICGGSVIDSEHILTAAHCVGMNSNKSGFLIGVGAIRLTNLSIFPVAELLRHRDYSPRHLANDIALIKVALGTHKFPEEVKPIELDETRYIKSRTQCTIVGWGKSERSQSPNELSFGHVNIVRPGICRNAFRTSLQRGTVCAEGIRVGSCEGDSGGGLICNNVLSGVTSYARFGYPDCAKSPTVYTQVFAFRHWIDRQIKGGSSRTTQHSIYLIVLKVLSIFVSTCLLYKL